MARKQEEKQKKNSEAASPYGDSAAADDEGSELVEQLTDFARQYGLYICIGVIAIIGIYYGASSAMGGGSDVPDLTSVYGTITREEGGSVNLLQVTFTPTANVSLNDESNVHGGGSAYTNNEGYYEIIYNGGHKGLPPGKYEVGVFDNGRKLLTNNVEVKSGQGALNIAIKKN